MNRGIEEKVNKAKKTSLGTINLKQGLDVKFTNFVIFFFHNDGTKCKIWVFCCCYFWYNCWCIGIFFFSDWDSLLNQPEVWLGNVFRKYKLAEKALRKLRFVLIHLLLKLIYVYMREGKYAWREVWNTTLQMRFCVFDEQN